MSRSLLKNRTNEEWVAALRGDRGPTQQAEAYEDLGKYLFRQVLGFLHKRQQSVPGLWNQAEEQLQALSWDFVQITLAKTHRNKIYDQHRGDAQFLTFMTKVALNVVRGEIRTQEWMSARISLPGEDSGEESNGYQSPQAATPEEHPVKAQVLNELRQAIEHCIEQLPARRRTAFILREVEELSIPEIQHRLSEPSANVVSILISHARSALKKCLLGKNWTPEEVRRHLA